MSQNGNNPQPSAWVSTKSKRAQWLLLAFFLWPIPLFAILSLSQVSTWAGEDTIWVLMAVGLGLLARQLL